MKEREKGGQKKIKEEEREGRDSEAASSEDARTERKQAREEAEDPLALRGRRRLRVGTDCL